MSTLCSRSVTWLQSSLGLKTRGPNRTLNEFMRRRPPKRLTEPEVRSFIEVFLGLSKGFSKALKALKEP